MSAFYNEIDPFAAAWLRELIKAGHIAPGVVDGRSIEDIKPRDLDGFSQCHFFAGIGVWSLALRRAGWPDDRPVWTGSCPCQPFSAAGQGAGFDDQRHLWPHFHWLIQECKPASVIGEQVASKDADPWIDLVQTDLEALGFAFGAVAFPSAGVGAPHIRDRTYWVAHAEGDGHQRPRGLGQSAGWNGAAHSGTTGILANTNGQGPQRGERRGVDAQQPAIERNGEAGRMADNDQHGRDAQPLAGLHNAQHHVEPCGGAGGLGHAGAPGRQPVSNEPRGNGEGVGSPRRESVELSQTSGNAGGLADADLRGRQPQPHPECTGVQPAAHGATATREQSCHDGSSVPSGRGPTNGFWSDADWLFCRDGKWRPVEPGTFPLAHGSPARVGRLRGYGNAINAHQAQIFIETVMP